VTFFVRKAFATGRLRFGVERRSPIDEIDNEPLLSTGPAGEFVRRRSKGFYFAAPRPLGRLDRDRESAASSNTLFDALKPDGTPRGWAFLGMMLFGVLLVLIGLAVVMTKGPVGWIEVIFGLVLIVAPIAMTARERQQIRAQEARERAEIEAEEAHRQEILASYLEALERLRRERSDEALAEVTRQRQNLDLPYEAWAPVARRAVLDLAFETLARLTPQQGDEAAASIDRTGTATGLLPGDIHAVKQELVATITWHLLADDRLGKTQLGLMSTLQRAMKLGEADLPQEGHASKQFDQLRGLTADQFEKQSCTIPLLFNEQCFFSTRATSLLVRKVREEGGQVDTLVEGESFSLYVTSRRILLDSRKRLEVPLVKIDDIDVDVDARALTLRLGKPLKPITIRVDDPILTAGIIEIALDAEPRPRSFA
jgi:hypothetical protein